MLRRRRLVPCGPDPARCRRLRVVGGSRTSPRCAGPAGFSRLRRSGASGSGASWFRRAIHRALRIRDDRLHDALHQALPYAHLREYVASRTLKESPDPNVEIISDDLVRCSAPDSPSPSSRSTTCAGSTTGWSYGSTAGSAERGAERRRLPGYGGERADPVGHTLRAWASTSMSARSADSRWPRSYGGTRRWARGYPCGVRVRAGTLSVRRTSTRPWRPRRPPLRSPGRWPGGRTAAMARMAVTVVGPIRPVVRRIPAKPRRWPSRPRRRPRPRPRTGPRRKPDRGRPT